MPLARRWPCVGGMKEVVPGLSLCMRINYYAPIACLVRAFMNENVSLSEIFNLFLKSI